MEESRLVDTRLAARPDAPAEDIVELHKARLDRGLQREGVDRLKGALQDIHGVPWKQAS